MTDKLIDRIKADRETGTDGPWVVHDCESYGDRCKVFYQEVWNEETDILVTTEVTRAHNDGGSANMRRIARVPDMEARILADEKIIRAAEQLAVKARALINRWDSPLWKDLPHTHVCIGELRATLAAFRAAVAEQRG